MPEETTASMWADVNALKKEISMSEKERSKQRVERFLNELEGGTASLTDDQFARLERMIVEKRGRAAAYVIIAPIDAAQPSNPRSRCSEISCDVYVFVWRKTPKAGWTLSHESSTSSTGTGFEAPGQQCLLNWEMERTTVDGCQLVDGNSDLGENTFSLEELVIGTQTDRQTSASFASSKKRFPADESQT